MDNDYKPFTGFMKQYYGSKPVGTKKNFDLNFFVVCQKQTFYFVWDVYEYNKTFFHWISY